ncbi:hypothetical protein Metfor_1788 [Methanoregula formicica SMSP]|uniref:Uncharacterized protein n=1 Tax=Methanoregula formicica (strain DSM 22288 / NBRC 105244 / SMSP) TaxID=593750 RepID=L0HGA0_METFS|nr:hypothetical protein Metfor_1788 [Methanoregula formicica SMSP]
MQTKDISCHILINGFMLKIGKCKLLIFNARGAVPCAEVQNMKKQEHMNRQWWMASAVVLLFVALAVAPVAADYP